MLLLSFQEQNIRVENANRFRRRQPENAEGEAAAPVQNQDEVMAGPSTSNAPSFSSFPSTSASASISKPSEPEAAKPVRPRPKTKRSQNYDESDEEEDEDGDTSKMDLDGEADYEPPAGDVVMRDVPVQQRIYVSNTAPIGSLAYCADCRKRFSVTAYT